MATDSFLESFSGPVVIDIVMPTNGHPNILTIWFREGYIPISSEIPFITFIAAGLGADSETMDNSQLITPKPSNRRLRNFVTHLAYIDGVLGGVVYRERITVQCSPEADKRSWVVRDTVALIAKLFDGKRDVSYTPVEGYTVRLARKG